MTPLKRNILQLTLIGLLCVAAVAAYGYFFLAVRAQNQTISRLENDITLQKKKEAELHLIKTNLERTEEARAKLDSHFVSYDHVVDFLNYLEAQGKNAQALVEIQTVTLADNKNTTPAKSGTATPIDAQTGKPTTPMPSGVVNTQSLTVTLKASGSFVNVYQFLLLMENLPYEVDINSLMLRKNTNEAVIAVSGPWEGDFTLTVRSFITTKQ